ncbi:MAG: NifU N-terminal domain-containing protein [Gemmatimonadota bacterium]
MSEMRVSVQGTPNPNAAKFVLDHAAFGEASRSYFHPIQSGVDPLAEKLFAVRGVVALLMADNFITVTKSESVQWSDIVESIEAVIRAELGSPPS